MDTSLSEMNKHISMQKGAASLNTQYYSWHRMYDAESNQSITR